MTAKIFNISLPEELLKIIDWQAKLNYATRSEYVKSAILARLKSEGAIDKNGWRQQSLEDQKKEQLKQFLEEYRMGNYSEDQADDLP